MFDAYVEISVPVVLDFVTTVAVAVAVVVVAVSVSVGVFVALGVTLLIFFLDISIFLVCAVIEAAITQLVLLKLHLYYGH